MEAPHESILFIGLLPDAGRTVNLIKRHGKINTKCRTEHINVI